ncbi:hypothetical protein CYMTET_19718 [Cymbomonas tetramitiformis]|uniref:Uncharacterized protein n=2 Tax=Cymbomonas tetramitiformis TaxID=36881 RepID=A0AAE0G5I6_9CHLO|nr:hypothetical protein CYMTET_19718 [Cymbomonas tetramitiformis]
MTNLLDEDTETHLEIPQLLQVTGETFFYARLQQLIFSEPAAAPTLLTTTIVFTVTDPYVLTLTPHQTAIVSVDLPGPTEMASSVSEMTYYAEQMMVPFVAHNFTAFDLSINVTNGKKVRYARARVGLWGQAEDAGTELLHARWNNGSSLLGAAEDAEAGQRSAPPFDNDDSAFLTGVELSIPVELVSTGDHQIELYFSGSGVVTSVVLVLGEGETLINSSSDLSNMTWPPPYTPGIPIPPVSPPPSPLLSPPAGNAA